MKRVLSVVLATIGAAAPAAAGNWEISVAAGKAFPFYGQRFEYDPGPLSLPFSGARVEQRGTFRLDATGALALGGALSYFPTPHFGVEARLDTADLAVDVLGAAYRVRVDLPAPLPDLSTDVDLGNGEVDLERLRPLSLGVRLRTGGRTRAGLGAGVSYLPAFRFTVVQGIGVGVPDLRGGQLGVEVAQVRVRAEALPQAEGEGRLGAHLGVTVEHALSPRVHLLGEVRYFHFQRQTLNWGLAESTVPLPELQEEIVRQVRSRLEPVSFSPAFFHARAGMVLVF